MGARHRHRSQGRAQCTNRTSFHPTRDRLIVSATTNCKERQDLGAANPNSPVHFKLRAPGKTRKIPRTVRTTSDGFDVEVEWEYSWAPGLQQAGRSIEEIAEVVERILNHSRGWVRAEILFPRIPVEQAQGSSATSQRDRPGATGERPARSGVPSGVSFPVGATL